jgi:hypothetical protein
LKTNDDVERRPIADGAQCSAVMDVLPRVEEAKELCWLAGVANKSQATSQGFGLVSLRLR